MSAGSATIIVYLPRESTHRRLVFSGDANFNPDHSAKVNVYATP